jgi:uncharacterized repeat protein (TIGR01451 family)
MKPNLLLQRTQRNTRKAVCIAFPLACFLLLAGVGAASAQCYTFSSGSAASLTVNITHLPAPTKSTSVPWIYQYSSTSGLTGTMSLTVGQTTYTQADSSPTMLLSVGDDTSSNFSSFEINVAFQTGNFIVAGGLASLNWSGNFFPNGSVPATLPPLSQASDRTLIVNVIGPSGTIANQTLSLTSVTSCSAGPTGPPASAPTLQTLETYKGPDPTNCNSTVQVSNSFSPADITVNAFWMINGMNPAGGDTTELHWINPSGSWATTSTAGPTANTGSSTRCFFVDTSIAQWIAPNWGQWQIQVFVNGNSVGSPYSFQVSSTSVSPALSILKTHSGNFVQGQQGAAYTITVVNSGTATTNGQVTVTENLPSGLSLVSMSGLGWNCPTAGDTCSRSDSLNSGGSYPVITVTVGVASNAPASVINQATVSEGGASQIATDLTIITAQGGTSGALFVQQGSKLVGTGRQGVRCKVSPWPCLQTAILP